MEHDDLKPAEPIKYPSELPKAGWHPAVCAQAHSLGYQMFGNEVGSYPQAALIFELAAKRVEGDYAGTPLLLSWKGSNVLSKPDAKKKGNLTIMLEGWTGHGMNDAERAKFSLRDMIGRAAFINVKHETGKDGVVRAKIASIGPMPDGIPAPSVSLTDVPKWIAEMKAKQVAKPTQAAPGEAPPHGEDDLPDFLK